MAKQIFGPILFINFAGFPTSKGHFLLLLLQYGIKNVMPHKSLIMKVAFKPGFAAGELMCSHESVVNDVLKMEQAIRQTPGKWKIISFESYSNGKHKTIAATIKV